MGAARSLAAAVLALFLCAVAAFAFDDAELRQSERAAENFRADLARIEKELQLPTITDALLTAHRKELEDIRVKALAAAASLAQPVAEVKQQIDLLGPPPAPGKTEDATVTAERATLNSQYARITGVKSQLELAAVNAEQIARRASAQQRGMFLTRIFEGGRSILHPLLWLETGLGAGQMATRLGTLFSNWWADVSTTANAAGLALIPVFLAMMLSVYLLARGRLRRWSQAHMAAIGKPGDIDRLWRVVRGIAGTFAGLLIIFIPVIAALKLSGYMTPRFELVFNPLIDVVFSTTVYWMLARRIAAPGLPEWRLIDVDDVAAGRLPVLVGLAAFVTSAARGSSSIADGLFLPVSYTIGQAAITDMLLLTLLALILFTVRKQDGIENKRPGQKLYFTWAGGFVPVLWLLVLAGVLALLFGYVALATYLAQQIFETAVLVTVLFLLHHLSDATVAAAFDPQSSFGRYLRKATGMGERAIERLGLVFRTFVDLVLVAAGLPLLFLLWTVTWVDFRSMVTTAFVGFRIGDITLSPWSVIVVALMLLAGVVITKLLVRWLDRRILSETHIDKGVQDSLRMGASYAGYIIAALVALTAAGLDFSNLALIAGALGVGIGLGLQSIVNNFVSGLILLAERPVRVGDWVAVGAGEGIVKRIHVRSTEIETFDSCSIIVPNSNLITESVRNWTHGDTMGRFTVAVTVEYGSDDAQVVGILAEVARAHPKVLTYPEPLVLLVRFGPFGLDYEVKANVAHIFDGAAVASEMRHAILARFAEKSIVIAQQTPLASKDKSQ